MQVSNYFVLDDDNFELNADEMKRFIVKMPPAAQFVRATARPILWLTIHPRSDHAKFIVILNDAPGDPNNIPNSKIVFVYDFEGTVQKGFRGVHEVLDGNQFIAGGDNFIDFRVIIGKVLFSDVVLHFRLET
jgi:hypothetical protein